jgi:hypothetical protein
VPLESVEVAEGGRLQDGRAESQDRRIHRLLAARLQQIGQSFHAEAEREVRVESRDGLAKEGAVVRPGRLSCDQRAASSFEVQPAPSCRIEGCSQAPRGAGG